uniref:Uncharacterized protein n=1 Tax=Avena sativa TaxID=4498 RepID=A0ACD5Y1A9_AVESA
MFSFKSSFKSSSSGKEVSKPRFPEALDMREELDKLQEELVKEKQEKVRSLDEMEEVKKTNKKNNFKGNGEHQLDLAHRLEQLEVELETARDSEKQMLASLEAQTKQLEQTKVSLEEAKLQIASLQDNNKSLEAFTALSSNPGRQPAKNFRRRGVMSFSFADPGEVETLSLQRQLKLAVEAEEKCKKAMDDLAIALTEQTTVAREAKSELSLVEAELKSARTEVEISKASLESMEEKLWLAQEEAVRLKFESDELATASKEKERGLLDCIKIFEGEVNKAKEENDKLFESQRVIRDENSRLREMLKHAVNEANVARESLEIARVENSQLHEDMSEKDSTLKSIVQEYESLKVSEAAAQSSIKELKDMIDAMFISESARNSAEASPRDPVGGERKGRYVTADDMYSDVERSPHPKDIRSPARQNKRTILRKFGDIMKKRNPQSVV